MCVNTETHLFSDQYIKKRKDFHGMKHFKVSKTPKYVVEVWSHIDPEVCVHMISHALCKSVMEGRKGPPYLTEKKLSTGQDYGIINFQDIKLALFLTTSRLL